MWPARRRKASDRSAGRGHRPAHRLGLRSRVTLSFALGALVLSSGLGAILYVTTRTSILNQEQTAIATEALDNAVILKSHLGNNYYSEDAELTAIDSESKSQSLLYVGGPAVQWIAPHATLTSSDLPAGLQHVALANGAPASEIFRLHDVTSIGVGVPIPADNVTFFEVFSLAPTENTLHAILATLLGAAIVMTLAGTVLGRWAAGRALRPLRDVSEAALAIASGRLDTRLETADVRDLALLASSFNRMVDRLQQRIERDARFTSDVSHELRSPLTTLAASLSVLEGRREELPDRSRQALELLAAEIRRFQRMVGDLLEISRIDAGSADFDPNVVSVGDLIRNALASTHSNVPVEVPGEVGGRLIAVDKRRFERIMANLVENARRYAGGATRVAVVGRDETVRFVVEDEGPGVPPEERNRIFERFARGSVAAGSRGAGDGTGLGLALVAEHVKLHGGRVWVEGRPAGGSKFVVELPLLDESPFEDDEVAHEPTRDEPPGGTSAA